jgi:MFS family permease
MSAPHALHSTDEAGLQWRIVTVSILTITVAILPRFLPGALAVQLAESLGIAEAGIGPVVGAFFGMSALVSPRLGRIVERFGWAPAMRIASVGAALTLLLTPLVAESVLTLAAVTVAGGVALAIAHPAVDLGLARCTVGECHGLVYRFKHAAIPAATVVAGLGLPFIAIPFGWQWVYVLGATPAVGAVLLVPLSPGIYEVGHVEAEKTGKPVIRSSQLSLLLIVVVGAGLGIFGIDALATFLVPYAVDVGFAGSSAGMLLAVGSGLGILMRLIAGWTIDRRRLGSSRRSLCFSPSVPSESQCSRSGRSWQSSWARWLLSPLVGDGLDCSPSL